MNAKELITLASLGSCTGCMACGDVCPQACISLKEGKDGFWYPQINHDECIKCHACQQVCPIISPLTDNEQLPQVYAAWTDKKIRKDSASGGAFYAMAVNVILNGGYVAGAVFDGVKVKHILTNNYDDLKAIQGTKYFQSNAKGIFKLIKQLLKEGKTVLFSGTSCQVAGLLNVVGGRHENLITVDLICFGVPSPLTIEVEERMRGMKLKRIIKNRDKNHKGGWRNCYYMTCEWDNGAQTISSPLESFMLAAFNSGKVMRSSCYNCLFKNLKRQSDITIGDYHNVKDFDEEKNDGISLVMIHNTKGEEFIKGIQNLTLHKRPLCESLNGKRTIYYNDSMYGRHPMRKMMPWMLRHAPSWLLNISYRSFVKSKNPLVWPFSAFDYVYREINQRKANKKLKEVMNQINMMK